MNAENRNIILDDFPVYSSPLVSVIVPTFNRQETLRRTIASLLSQSYSNFEIIVVNDAGESVDELIHSFNTEKLILATHESNRGLPSARNTAINLSRGKYIAYLDDDDIFYPEHLQALVSTLERSISKVAYTDAMMDILKTVDGRLQTVDKQMAYSYDFSRDLFLISNYIPVLCIMHEKSCLDRVGLFDESLTSHEDWELWIRMSQEYDFEHIKRSTCEFVLSMDENKFNRRQDEMFESLMTVYGKTSNLVANRPDLMSRRLEYMNSYKKNVKIHKNSKANRNTDNPLFNSILGVSLSQIIYKDEEMANRVARINGYIIKKKFDLAEKIIEREMKFISQSEEILKRLHWEKLDSL
jgi:glycosyltransferase involved in cell wall biosynthesis